MPRTTNLTKTLSNGKTSVCFHIRDKGISGSDLTDQNNLPCFYNKTVRGIEKAWEVLEKEFTPETSMYGAMTILERNNIRCRSYCAMD